MMERLTKRCDVGLCGSNDRVVLFPLCKVSQNNEYNDRGLIQQCFKLLADYEDTNLTPTQLQEIDKLYAEKCKEIVRLKGRIKDLEYACDGHTKIINNIEKANQKQRTSWVKMKEERERLKESLKIKDNNFELYSDLLDESEKLKAELEQSVKLPCKVGDTVIAKVERPYNGHEAEMRGSVTDVQIVVRVKHGIDDRYINFLSSDFNKTVFLEEAEKALSEMKGGGIDG